MTCSAILTVVLLASWGAVSLYSKAINKEETRLEKILEDAVEDKVEEALSLPSGTLDSAIDFFELQESEVSKTNTKGDD
jgi:hypothetical protein